MAHPEAERVLGHSTADHEFLDPCVSGDFSALKAALDGKNPDANALDEMLAIAAYYQHLELIDYLFQKFPTASIGYMSILTACKTGSKDIVTRFLEKDPSILKVPHFVGTPLTAAIGANTPLDFLEFLIGSGADLNWKGATHPSVLHFATLYSGPSFIEVVSLLLRKGARLEKSAALSGAIQSANSRNEKVKFLLGQGADPNTDVDASDASTLSPPPLHTAVAVGDLELVNLLLEHGADPNLKAWDNCTAFDFNGKSQQDIEDALKAAAERYNTQSTHSKFY